MCRHTHVSCDINSRWLLGKFSDLVSVELGHVLGDNLKHFEGHILRLFSKMRFNHLSVAIHGKNTLFFCKGDNCPPGTLLKISQHNTIRKKPTPKVSGHKVAISNRSFYQRLSATDRCFHDSPAWMSASNGDCTKPFCHLATVSTVDLFWSASSCCPSPNTVGHCRATSQHCPGAVIPTRVDVNIAHSCGPFCEEKSSLR